MLALAALALSIPLYFEPNQGQAGSQAGYVAVAPGYTLTLSDTGIAMRFPRNGLLRMNFPHAVPEAVDPLPGKTNYYLSADPAAWRTGISIYARVRYRSVFRGVDLVVYGNQQEIEYDWVVSAGADPSAIRFSVTGASHLSVDANGDLLLEAGGHQIRHRKPDIYQVADGGHRRVQGGFVLRHGGQVRFRVGAYDKRLPLVIDPKLIYSTGFGGSGIAGSTNINGEGGTGIAIDPSGAAYITGIAYSTDFPFVNPLGTVPRDFFQAVFVAKLSSDGSTLLYSTYISFNNNPQFALAPPAVAVDSKGNAYVTGNTDGAGFPDAGNSTATPGHYHAFLLALDPTGALLASQIYGGSGQDAGTSIALGQDGNLYLAGVTSSPNFPTTPAAYRKAPLSSQDVFLMKINPQVLDANVSGAQSPVVYSTYLGPGSSAAVAADRLGNAYVSATTTSTAWTATPGVIQPNCAGESCADVVALKVNPSGNQLLYMTYFGGSGTEAVGGLAVDQSGSAFIAGLTSSSDLPTTGGAYQQAWQSPTQGQTAFIAKLDPNATKAVYATYLGGGIWDQAFGVAVDGSGNAYVAGETLSPGFPILNAIQVSLANPTCIAFSGPPAGVPIGLTYCPSAGFLSVLNPAGSALVWSTFLGSATATGAAGMLAPSQYRGPAYADVLDSSGNVYVTGQRIGIGERIVASSPSDRVGVVKIAQQGSPPQFPASGLTNGASFLPGLPAPGGLATLFLQGLNVSGIAIGTGDPLPTELDGVSIMVGGFPAPILAVTDTQVNFQVPFEAQTNLVELRYQGLSTFVLPQAGTPGIFMLLDGSAAIQHASDYSLVTAAHPAVPGEVIVIYATGLGPVTTGVADGTPAAAADPVQLGCGPPGVVLGATPAGEGGTTANVLYAGLTPGYVGLYQMNVQVPPATPAGPSSLFISWQGCALDSGASNSVTLFVE